MMRRKITLAVTLLLIFVSGGVNAQSFLKKVSSAVSSVATSITGGGSVSASDVVGTWTYSGPAVSLQGSSTVANVASSVATATAESTLGDTFSKLGITPGIFTFTFGSDNTFSCVISSRTISGTYSVDESANTISLSLGSVGTINLGSMTANASISGSTLSMVFDADKLLSLVSAISSITDSTTLSLLDNIASSYEDAKIGFKLTK